MSVSQLVNELATRTDAPVKLFLNLPAKEADARFRKMFVTLGKHPIVGVGALGGLVALFAYAKALAELNDIGLQSTGLLAAGDIADFASRFAVPFVLTVAAFISLVLVWTDMLKADHRRPGKFLLALLPGMIGLIFTYAGYFWWVDLHPTDSFAPTSLEKQICTFGVPLIGLLLVSLLLFFLSRVVFQSGAPHPPGTRIAALALALVAFGAWYWWIQGEVRLQLPELLFAAAFVAAIVPALPLMLAGMEPGVEKDQRWQYGLLEALRWVSTAFGLLVVFSILATILLFSASVSVLAVRKDLVHRPAGGHLRVIESKQTEPILINPGFVRLSSVWIVDRVSVLSQSPAPAALPGAPVRAGPASTMSAWWIVTPGDIACVRFATKEDLSPAPTPPKRLCSTSPNKTAPQFPDNSIASYAIRMLGCAPDTFKEDASAWVVRFKQDEPRTVLTGRLEEGSWSIPVSFLGLPGLQGVRTLPREPDSTKAGLLERLQKEKPSSIWVLGFASTEGKPAHNLNLSERRAARLREVLKSELPKEEKRIKARGLGEDTYPGIFAVQESETDRIAVAFLCRPMQ
jgi:hypothetical protein